MCFYTLSAFFLVEIFVPDVRGLLRLQRFFLAFLRLRCYPLSSFVLFLNFFVYEKMLCLLGKIEKFPLVSLA